MRSIRITVMVIFISFLCLGIVMIYSASGVYAFQELGDSMYYLNRHLLFLLIGFLATFFIMAMDYRDLKKYAKPLILLAIFLLILVLIPHIGKASFGARRWFKLGPFQFQPSEFAKMVLLIYSADYLARKQNKMTEWKGGLLPLLAVLGTICLLIVKQPDLGNSFLAASMVIVLIFVAGARVWHLGVLILMMLPFLIYLIVKVPYRMARIMAFLDPWNDPQGAGFQLTQSQIALGSGGFWGAGLGKSLQKLFYLPAAHTDFIFSIIGEELGLIGTLAVVVLFALFIWQGGRIAKRTKDPFGYYLAVGIVAMLGLQTIVNLGVSIGALPTKGLPLPFISYGGSALIFNMMAVGLLLNISRTEDRYKI